MNIKKTLTGIVLGSALVLGVTGCSDVRIEYSDIKTTNAKVVRHDYYQTYGRFVTYDNYRTDFKSSNNSAIPYYTSMEKSTYDKFQLGDSVKVYYQEQFEVTYETKDNKNIKEPVETKLVDYDIVNIEKIE